MEHAFTARGRGARALSVLRGLMCCAALLVLSLSSHSRAQSSGLLIGAAPLLGSDAPAGGGWFGCVVQLHNTTDAQLEGVLELIAEVPWSSDEQRIVTQAPFAVAGKGRVSVQLPTHGFRSSTPALKVLAKNSKGEALASQELPEPRMPEPLLFDLTTPSKLTSGLRGRRVAVRGARLRGSYGPPMLALGSPQIERATGDPALPTRAAGYANATVVVARSEAVTRLTGPALNALGSWVLAGGALALHISRPEDMRSPVLQSLTGGAIKSAPPSAALKGKSEFIIPRENSSSPYGGRGFGSTLRMEVSPSDAVGGELVSFAGGNLRPSPWGASASYGLGEVHLLAFDTTEESHVTDNWVQLKLLDLVRHAWARQQAVVFPHALTDLDSSKSAEIRRVLDPNEGARWAIAVALLILLLYAVLAGPVNFYLATKRGRPLRALWHLPIWAAGTLLLIVGLGAVAKGVVGRARHVSLIEAGAGMPRAAITRYRGFFASSSEELVVRGSAHESVLDLFGENGPNSRVLVIDRDGVRLEKLRAKPWQTVVVREDSFVKLGGGVSLVPQGTDLVIVNRSAHDLRGAVAKLAGGDAFFFDRIKDGESVQATAGQKLPGAIGSRRYGGTAAASHEFNLPVFMKLIEDSVKGGGSAWNAIEAAASDDVDWWPDDVPALIAQIEGGEGRTSDSGLKLDSDRLLLRVVGYGGVP